MKGPCAFFGGIAEAVKGQKIVFSKKDRLYIDESILMITVCHFSLSLTHTHTQMLRESVTYHMFQVVRLTSHRLFFLASWSRLSDLSFASKSISDLLSPTSRKNSSLK